MSTITHPQPEAARFDTRWPETGTLVITAQGEFDAANAQELVDTSLAHGGRVERLVLDMTNVDFFGTSGFSALHALNARCAGECISWASVPSAAVARLLTICDPDSALPFYSDIDGALSAVQGEPRRLLKLVPETS